MLDTLSTISFSLLEMVFLFSVLLILHDVRHILGTAAFYIVMGLLFMAMQVFSILNMSVTTTLPGMNFRLSFYVLFLPLFTMLLVIYYTDGTEAVQKLILALMSALGVYAYLAIATMIQIRWGKYHSELNFLYSDTMRAFLKKSLYYMAAVVVATITALVIMPIVFQTLRRFGCHLFIQVTGALTTAQFIHSIVLLSIRFWGTSLWWDDLCATFLARSLSLLILSAIATIYLSRCTSESLGKGRSPIDVVLSFLGASRKVSELTGYLAEAQARYKLLFSSAADMIVFFKEDGKILEINDAGKNMLDLTRDELRNKTFADLTGLDGETWKNVINKDNQLYQGMRCDVTLPKTGREITLSFSITRMGGITLFIAIGHDETESRRLSKERNEWQMNVMHSQRLESIGRLAGGIAHDFNNYLHAAQGHLDLIRYMHPVEDKDVNRHLGNINQLTEKAAALTQKLLGFARKGNYHEEDIELNGFIRQIAELCRPAAQAKHIEITTPDQSTPVTISGDPIQLQQVIINVLFNAEYAIEKSGKNGTQYIRIMISGAEEYINILRPPDEIHFTKAEDYCALRISDTGTGIDKTVMNRLFEPFFSTKPVGEGTGMGLSMAYGILIQHKGWIQAENNPDGGACFTLILPLKKESAC